MISQIQGQIFTFSHITHTDRHICGG